MLASKKEHVCIDCGTSLEETAPQTKRCSACRTAHKYEYCKNNLWKNVPMGRSKIFKCVDCGADSIRRSPKQVRCSKCAEKYKLMMNRPKSHRQMKSMIPLNKKIRHSMKNRDPKEIEQFNEFQRVMLLCKDRKFDRNVEMHELISMVIQGIHKDNRMARGLPPDETVNDTDIYGNGEDDSSAKHMPEETGWDSNSFRRLGRSFRGRLQRKCQGLRE